MPKLNPMPKYTKTVGELREAMADLPATTPVVGTWEGTFTEVIVYRSAGGTLVLDVDDGQDRSEIESGATPVPGEP